MSGDGEQGNADERLAVNLRSLREDAGMPQAEIARLMAERGWPWHQSTVYRVETGKQAVRFGEAASLAEILKVPLDRLTWSTPESDAVDTMLRRGADLVPLSAGVSGAVERLLAARADAEETLAATEGSEWQQVLTFRPGLAERIDRYTLDAAIAEGLRRYEDRSAEKEDGNAAQGES
jgi:transcriptional regulator with XRE-family HTH domain